MIFSQTDSEVIAHLVANLYNGHSAFGDRDASPETKGEPLESIRAALRFAREHGGYLLCSLTDQMKSLLLEMVLLLSLDLTDHRCI